MSGTTVNDQCPVLVILMFDGACHRVFKKDLIKDKIFTKLNQEPKMIDLPQSEEDWNKLLQLSRHQIDEQKEKIKESEAFRKKKESLPKEMFEIVPFEKSASFKVGTEK